MDIPQLVSASHFQTENCRTTPAEVERRSANFSPSVWGEYFLKYESNSLETVDIEADECIQKLKEEVKTELLSSPPSMRLDLIDYIQRLGVSHHFKDEIYQLLQQIHNKYYSSCSNDDEDDLHTVALRFRLLRQQGFKVSCDMFNKFIDADGNLKESCIADVLGLLSLYETSHMRTHGEEFLDRALIFTTSSLKLAATQLSPPLANQVAHALYQPLRKGHTRVEARHFLSSYHELNNAPHFSQTLLNFARMNFNHYQRFHQKELAQLTRWGKDLDFVNKLPFARDRLVECYLWSMGFFFEPKYRFTREAVCKTLACLSLIDDTFDTHGKLDELELFHEAIQRWDLSAMDPLPTYMKVLYETILNTFTDIENELTKEGTSYRIVYIIEKMQCQVQNYLTETKWYHQKHTPETYDEYMKASLLTSGMYVIDTSFLVALPESTRDSLEWLCRDPRNKTVNSANLIGRLMNDIQSRKREQKSGNMVSAVECYMKEHGVAEEEAVMELNNKVDDAWKDVIEEFVEPPATIPREILVMCLGFLQATDFIYRHADAYTDAEVVLKDHITSLFVEPADM